MRQFYAAHLEVKKDFKENFQTHPYKTGWASECIFFIMVEKLSGINSELIAEVELSHHGVIWAKEGSVLGPITAKGLNFIRVNHFGNWLRLNCQIDDTAPCIHLLIQIALKE